MLAKDETILANFSLHICSVSFLLCVTDIKPHVLLWLVDEASDCSDEDSDYNPNSSSEDDSESDDFTEGICVFEVEMILYYSCTANARISASSICVFPLLDH